MLQTRFVVRLNVIVEFGISHHGSSRTVGCRRAICPNG
jgi:hypothetical protein